MSKQEPLVSIITLCLNGEKYIDRYAKALLNQNYSNCQLIFMDDGSTDQTREKIFEYKERFEEKGFSFEYYFHLNCGTGATMAEAVQYIHGDYIIWPDVDDTLTWDSIAKKINFLENNLQYGIVRTDFSKIYDNNPDVVIERGAQKYPNRWKEELFEDYLLSNQAWLQPGCFMMRTSAFLSANPDRYIFPTRRGQNWQMLLPVLYKFKCGYIDEPLYNYYLHEGSLSDISKETPEDELRKFDMYEELIIDTVDHIKMEDARKREYLKKVKTKYLKQKIDVCFRAGRRYDAIKLYEKLVDFSGADAKYKVKSLITGTILGQLYLKKEKTK